MMKNLGSQVENIWKNLRPVTKEIIVGALKKSSSVQKKIYDVHSDWELSRLLKALDDQLKKTDGKKLREIRKLADICADLLQSQTKSAEVFIQLVERALKQQDFAKVEALCQILNERFPVSEVCEIIRQTENPTIKALAYEALSLFPTSSLLSLINDPVYADIAKSALEIQAFDYDLEEAKEILSQIEGEMF
ncbi:MAG: hypothetical protein N2Z23_08410 [Pyrinomonadaceae bacterium]|nr:hypothetical protein [Pyrinomonadaceae bacterium]MCX7640443.1 hypothetical protein [Pyrinomonadaceae bacterium]MDW8304870.1 hypothetical protein [Acidobacteriota bacterium]